ncbi:MBL fold metallo-hydrolase RNA specificity domain-containing protein [Sediminitomix flava]|uniref:Metallo-beta-lactamase family protein n=1 Tax=Sediminitomix flava TaxID=379075 RepID=A0A315ZGE0_SEDFL|nr:MBL fold metallo-hydrolase [Sediminitomix flava]PWJ43928.1 metallo-beta-lactamase family protein [Sediminitomix flava]
MKLTFWGAAKQVTGSAFLLELEDDYRVLIDCGLDMGNMKEDMPLYAGSSFPFDPSMVNLVLLTHAHLDHSGKIPLLYNEGFEGQVLCTSPTLALAEILLLDSANINMKKKKAYQKEKSRGGNLKRFTFNPDDLYSPKDVKNAIDRFVPIQFKRRFNVKEGLDITFIPTGHLLGAANIYLHITENGEEKTILFSGDIGRKNYPLLQDPEEAPQADYLVCETTYGNRYHSSISDSSVELIRVIKETCVDKTGRLIIPAFSIGRTQAVLYTLHQLYANNELPPIKIFADSPLALKSNNIYENYSHFLNVEAQEFKKEFGSLFDFDHMHYVHDTKDSKAISNYNEPCIIISSSGMIEGGRIQHHIRANIENPYSTIMMVGFSAEGTLGAKLLNKEESLKFDGREVPVLAKIEHTDSFSGHGDLNDLLYFVEQQDQQKLKQVFLVHGEEESMNDFKGSLEEKGYGNIMIPTKGDTVTL